MSDLTLAQLRLKNWKCFRGEHVLDLEPKAYAVFAHEEGNRERSNYLGKSSIAEAVDWLFYGRLVEEFSKRKKAVISRGEKMLEVEGLFSDGSRVKRTLSVATAEKVYFFPPGDPTKGAVGDAAEQRIEELLGLSKTDYLATRYFAQGKMAQLLTMEPSDRIGLIAGWFRLEKLGDCEGDAAGVLAEIAKRRDEAKARADARTEAILSAFDFIGIPIRTDPGIDALAAIDDKIAIAAKQVETLKAEAAKQREAVEREKTVAEDRAAAARYDSIVTYGTQLKEENAGIVRDELAKQLASTDDKLRAAIGKHMVAQEALAEKKKLLVVGFDGKCPVVGMPCPSRDFVTDLAKRSGEGLAIADASEKAEYVEMDGLNTEVAGLRFKLAEYDRKEARIRELRVEARRLLPSYERWKATTQQATPPTIQEQADLDQALTTSEHELATLQTTRATVLRLRDERNAARDEADKIARAVRTASAAAQIFGPAGAQRRLAESNLVEIEQRANEMLAESGINLSIRVVWSREGSGAAKTCAECGELFPKSERVKQCTRCGAPRGANVTNKLEIEPSAQSGGARDLGGIFFQFAAAEWLVGDRAARLAMALLDEPLAALDAYHRRMLSARLPTILRETGVHQAIVVAHHDGFLDALPGRIVVESKDGWSTVRVAA